MMKRPNTSPRPYAATHAVPRHGAWSFKLFSEIVAPDIRSRAWFQIDVEAGIARPWTHEDVHSGLAAPELSPAVPENIYHSFLTARHLELYSWFVYRFTMPAQLQAYATLEYALRKRL